MDAYKRSWTHSSPATLFTTNGLAHSVPSISWLWRCWIISYRCSSGGYIWSSSARLRLSYTLSIRIIASIVDRGSTHRNILW